MCKENKQNVSFETKCQGTAPGIRDQYNSISFPIYQTATFAHTKLGDPYDYSYTRQTNPTRQQLEAVVAGLENGKKALAFASGMAAIAAVMELFQPGDHILVDSDLYGGSVRIFDTICKKNGMTFSTADFYRDNIEEFLKPETKAVYLETPTNPMMNVTDLVELSKITKKHGVKLIVDNTFLSPAFQNPLDLGADIVVHSGTKYLCGHHDTIGGFVVINDEELDAKLRYISTTVGSALAPFDSWLILRGIRTLAIRAERAEKNALAIAEYLKTSPYVTKVVYPGLPEHPGHEIMKKQAKGFGSMVTFEVTSKEVAATILNNVELFYFAESLGGTETLITYPITQTHAEVPKDQLERNGINDRLLRLSVGIEGIDDLIGEFERVLALV